MIPYKHNQFKYIHHKNICLPIATLINAIENYFLEGFSLMKSKLVRKYLEKSPATAKGNMKRPCKGIISMRERPEYRVKYAIPTKVNQLQHLIPDE